MLSIISCTYWPFVYLLWTYVYSNPLLFFKTIFIYLLFIYYLFIWLREVFVETCGIFRYGACCGRQALPCGARASVQLQSAGFLFSSCGVGSRERGLCSLQPMDSLVEAHELSSCGAWALLPCGMWDLSSPTRDRTHVPCIGGGFFTTGPSGKSPFVIFKLNYLSFYC